MIRHKAINNNASSVGKQFGAISQPPLGTALQLLVVHFECASVLFQQAKQQGTMQNNLGNGYFKAGKYEERIEFCCKGIAADAMAYLKLKKYCEEKNDCNIAKALDGSYSKAFARRGIARKAMKKIKESKEDFETVLKLKPGTKQAKDEVENKSPEEKRVGAISQPPLGTALQQLLVVHFECALVLFQQAKQQGTIQNNLGNVYFKAGKYEEPIKLYCKEIAADAMAYLKLKKYCEEKNDCNIAIALDGSYSKAFARRGIARKAMKKIKESKEDFETVLKLKPGNKQAKDEKKTLHKQSTKPLNRIKIENVEDEFLPTAMFLGGDTMMPVIPGGATSILYSVFPVEDTFKFTKCVSSLDSPKLGHEVTVILKNSLNPSSYVFQSVFLCMGPGFC
uniref:Uncharacterized protein n=1 Tax=Erpetoichthys calabaricus TaxID=27687 RepID=A0A8C4X3K0_ERPCA